jgi:hypothetical protein
VGALAPGESSLVLERGKYDGAPFQSDAVNTTVRTS